MGWRSRSPSSRMGWGFRRSSRRRAGGWSGSVVSRVISARRGRRARWPRLGRRRWPIPSSSPCPRDHASRGRWSDYHDPELMDVSDERLVEAGWTIVNGGAADLRELLAPGRAGRQRRGLASAGAHPGRRRDHPAGADRDRLHAHAGRADGRVHADQRVRHRAWWRRRAPRARDGRPPRAWSTSPTRRARRRPRRRSTRSAASALPPGATRSCSAASRWPTS